MGLPNVTAVKLQMSGLVELAIVCESSRMVEITCGCDCRIFHVILVPPRANPTTTTTLLCFIKYPNACVSNQNVRNVPEPVFQSYLFLVQKVFFVQIQYQKCR